ncbi:hypothetical protein [Nocardiopsis sp. NPDC006938]|uniref:hypothetical protein n=1 Tax=Nocardiopsis sp. NPDC006938 TaxID=3364337 RepID=UPI00368F6E1B
MPSREDRFDEVDELARNAEDAVRIREEHREQERQRLLRMHTEESTEDNRLLAKIREIRMVELFYRTQGPERHLNLAHVAHRYGYLMLWFPPAIGWTASQEILQQSLGMGLAEANMWCGPYFVAVIALLVWHHHATWARPRTPRLLRIGGWTLAVLPVPLTLAVIASSGQWGALPTAALILLSAAVGVLAVNMAQRAVTMRELAYEAMRERDERL